MENLPIVVQLLFGICVFYSMWFFYLASKKNQKALYIILALIGIQSILGLLGFYTITLGLPPRFILLPLPPLLLIVWLLLRKSQQAFINGLSMKHLILLHVVRIPVEIVLYLLSCYKVVPTIMTFEGWNFDILSGISTLPVYYLYQRQKIGPKTLWIWNVICLVLLINIIGIAVLSAPFPIQQLAFEQPNIAVLYFPFNLLPGFVVPLVLFAHLAAIKKLRIEKK